MEDEISGMSKKERREMKKAMREGSASSDSVGRSLLIWGSVISVLLIGLFWLATSSKSKDKTETVQSVVDMNVTDKDWVRGNKDGKIVLVEYSDLQCPACKAHLSLVEEVLKRDSNIKLVYRHFPLRSIHKNAQVAAQAAEAAGMQGKFFEMHDILFANQEQWSLDKDPEERFISYAKEIGLDVDKFKTDWKSGAAKDLVEEDYKSAMQLRVNSTPTFFVNGKKIANPRSADDFLNLIQTAAK